MKYCPNCGREILDDFADCPSCGKVLNKKTKPSEKCSIMATIAFVFSIFTFVLIALLTVWFFTIEELGVLIVWLIVVFIGCPIGLISLGLSIFATCSVFQNKIRGGGFAIASLVLSLVALGLVLAVFSLAFTISAWTSLFGKFGR